MDLFDYKSIEPMLIKNKMDPFNSEDYIYEIKFDGIRCIAYLDKQSTDIRNKKDNQLTTRFPELIDLHKNVSSKCIIDGEIVVMKNGITDFYEVQRRTILSDRFKIQLASQKQPACFIAYDIIYIEGKEINTLPLIERKELLNKTVNENSKFAISRFIEYNRIELLNMARERKLEGVVAKQKYSLYHYGKRSKDWIKFKVLEEQNYIICGYLKNKQGMSDIIIGSYRGNELIYKGLVTLGVRLDFLLRRDYTKRSTSPFINEPIISRAVWLEPNMVCRIEYMPSDKEKLRQPVYKGIVDNFSPYECIER